MGQKTHPKAFRLVTTQKHLSEWYGTKLNYPKLIEEDYFVREKVHQQFAEFLSISKIEINRINQEIGKKEYVNITIHALFPRAKEMYRKVSKYSTTQYPIKKPTIKNPQPIQAQKKNFATILQQIVLI